MKSAIFAALVGSAAAFAPAPSAPGATSLNAKAKAEAPPGLIGALPPVDFFDPAGFAAKADDAKLARYREVEIMHGRFAQLATLGFIVPEKYAYDGAFGDDFLAPTGRALEVFNTDPVWVGLTFAVIGILEAVRLIETEPGTRADGRNEGVGWRPSSPEEFEKYQLREIQNGRLAMLAFAGMVAQELINDKPLYVNLVDSGFF